MFAGLLVFLAGCAVQAPVQLGPRPHHLVDGLEEGRLKTRLKQCENGPFSRSRFSIGHRGAPLQFPEHTVESYRAAARMGAGVLECDVTFTRDHELVCRHSQCDLHQTTNILVTPLAARCSEPFVPARYEKGERVQEAAARCCTSDLTLQEFLSLEGKMDGFNPSATTVQEYMNATPAWRTDLYAASGTLVSHAQSIELFRALGVEMTPELKRPQVPMPSNGFSQQDYAAKLVEEYRSAGVPAASVWPQSFHLDDVQYWIEQYPEFGAQAVLLEGRYEDPALDPADSLGWPPSMEELAAQGVNIIAPPIWLLLDARDGEIVPSDYALAAREAGLEIIAWTLERSGPLAGGGGWYYRGLNDEAVLIDDDSDMLVVLDVLAREVGVKAVFSDWPATTTYYANCMGLP